MSSYVIRALRADRDVMDALCETTKFVGYRDSLASGSALIFYGIGFLTVQYMPWMWFFLVPAGLSTFYQYWRVSHKYNEALNRTLDSLQRLQASLELIVVSEALDSPSDISLAAVLQ